MMKEIKTQIKHFLLVFLIFLFNEYQNKNQTFLINYIIIISTCLRKFLLKIPKVKMILTKSNHLFKIEKEDTRKKYWYNIVFQ